MCREEKSAVQKPYIHKLTNSLKLREDCGLGGISDECLRQSHFPQPWKEAEVITLPKRGKNPIFLHNLLPICLLSTTGRIFESYSENSPKAH
jgi:hypothetical protein